MKIIFREKNESAFKKLWHKFTIENKISLDYSFIMIEYFISTSSNIVADKSFVLEHNNKCLGICFLPIEKIKNHLSISILGGYVIAPFTKMKKNEKIIFNLIDAISIELQISAIYFQISPFLQNRYNKLLSFGFIDTTNHTCAIKLSNTKELLWTKLRKRYKALINSCIKDSTLNIEYSNETNFETLHNQYVTFHKEHMKNAGKQPKHNDVYNNQLNFLKENTATIIAIKHHNSTIITDYFFHDSKTVIYASSSYNIDEKFKSLPLNHYLLWEAILYFKSNNFEMLGFGQPCSFNYVDGFENYSDDKELNISHFKKGMGVEIIQNFQGIKFFNKRLLSQKIDYFKIKIGKIYEL